MPECITVWSGHHPFAVCAAPGRHRYQCPTWRPCSGAPWMPSVRCFPC